MTPEQEDLVRRVHAALPPGRSTRDVPMFGGVSIMVDDALVVAAGQDGSLLVRADAQRHDELTSRPGAAQAEMKAGRVMGPGWIRIDRQALAGDDLAWWIDVAMDHHASQSGG